MGMPSSMDRKWLVAAAVGGMAIALLLVYLWYTAGGSFVLRTIDYVVQNLASRSGISVFLVRGAVIIASIPFFWAVYRYTSGFWLPGLRPSLRLFRNPYGMLIVAYVGLFFIAMYFASREAYFYKYCAETPEGLKTSDSAGVDPTYGIRFKRCTLQQIERLKGVNPKLIKISDPRTYPWFDGITGEPRVWYYKFQDGTYQFYDRPGKHPVTGGDLTPITRSIVEELIRRPKAPGCDNSDRWYEQEGRFSSTWVRRGSSKIFDVIYNVGTTTVNTVSVSGDRVHAERINSSDGNLCAYDGRIGTDGRTITGTYHTIGVGTLYSWSATIDCDATNGTSEQ
jgi:hypothetical protein